ncbi:hypothetical protein KR074_001994 [Drosophila pseudoananassae]|nr:hypothetical protein KR074_001994 [Drosophila pseudoananassae]
MTAHTQEEEEVDTKTPSMSQTVANNNINNNSQRIAGSADGDIVNQTAESAMFFSSMAPPEVLGMAGQFPVGRGITYDASFPMNQQKHQNAIYKNSGNNMTVNGFHQQCFHSEGTSGKFPMHQKVSENLRFPMDVWNISMLKQENLKQNISQINNHIAPEIREEFVPIYQVYAQSALGFPVHHVYAPLGRIFPDLKQLPRKNSGDNDALPLVSTTMTRRNQVISSPVAIKAPPEFPIIKKRFVTSRRFPNYRPTANANDGTDDDNDEDDGPGDPSPHTNSQQTTTMTQTSLDKVTKIDIEGGGDDVYKAFDNELEAGHGDDDEWDDERRAAAVALNLNATIEVALVAREIEHQQAENFNDAFGPSQNQYQPKQKQKLHDHKNSRIGENRENENDDAMNLAKNKHEICEQSKLEKAEDHNELNMTKSARDQEQHQQQSQSICFTREQTIDDIDRYGIRKTTNHHQLSDARESSPEQDREPNPYTDPYPIPITVTRPNIELLKSSVRAFLNDTDDKDSSPPDWDWELIDLLTEAIELLCEKAETGNLWSEEVEGAERSDMTVTKVSEERDSETVDVYPEPLDQHTPEVDDNNNSQIGDPNSSNEMKYELRSTTAPTTATLPIRSSRLPETPTSRLSTTSTSRGLPTSTSTASTPLLGELKRSSSSRDDISIDPESVLPERTRLRRQRRMRSQDSVEEKPEDVIERLNKLKARISGALSEVKNVIKQYSTESEAEAAGETPVVALSKPSSSAGEKEPSSAPVPFRFVKKIRRRSYFDEAEEEREQAGEDHEKVSQEEVKETKIKREATPFPKEDATVSDKKESELKEKLEEKDIPESNAKEVLQETDVQTKEDSKIVENHEAELIEKSETKLVEKDTTESNQEPKKAEQISKPTPHKVDPKESEPTDAIKVNGEVVQTKPPEKNKTQTKIEFLAKVQSELKSKPTKEKIDKKPNEVKEPTPKSEKEEHPEKPTADVTDDSSQAGAQAQATPKIKKKVIVKVKNSRRASIAAVEPSKIKVEPAVEQSDALIAQRRPSDSEAIVKRKKKLKLMGPIADATTTTAAAAAVATISTTSGYQRETTDKQATSPEVKTVPAKLPIAKSGQGEATTATEATATAIDGDSVKSGNQAPSPERSRRASLKLDELVGGTLPLVVPAGKSDIPAPEPQTLRPEPPAQALPSIDESKEPINQVQSHVQVQQVAIGADIAPQIEATLRHEESSAQPSVEATKVAEQSAPADSLESAITMPELKVIAGPVQPVKIETVEQPLDVGKSDQPLVVGKKKPTTATPHLKKLVRKNSIDKKDKDVVEQQKQDSTKLSNILRDKNKINELSSRINKLTPPKKRDVKPKEEPIKPEDQPPKPEEETPLEIPTEAVQHQEEEQVAEPEPEPEPAPVPKKVRKVKKKVIIKRQKRRLSIGDTFFLQPEPEEPQIPEIETIERAIAYVTDDEDEPEPQPEEKVEPEPRKSCLHVREYKIGDQILYAERYRKTQVRWKRGRVLERITSISYKLEIEGKEVPAHVSYIKKYTGRKVRFGGKEYLEIDYEQVAEEERRAASYSIWNMV